MKYIDKKQYRIIYDDDAGIFEKDLNAAINDLADYDPEVTIDGNRQNGFLAYLTYTEDHQVPENVADELEVRGLQATCSDCPYLRRTTDNTRKKFPCKFSKYGTSYLSSPACDKFYHDLIDAFREMKEDYTGLYEGYRIYDGTDLILSDAIDLAIDQGKISAAMLMKQLRISHSKAILLLDRMEEEGIISEREGNRKRYVLVSDNPCKR